MIRKPIREIKTKAEKHQKSSFLLTINTNVTDESMIGKLRSVFNIYYHNLDEYITFKDCKGNIDLVDNADCEVAIEKGPIYKRIHLHALIQIEHRTKIHLNLNKMRDFFKDQLGLTSFHMNCKYAQSLYNLKEYLRKNPIVENM